MGVATFGSEQAGRAEAPLAFGPPLPSDLRGESVGVFELHLGDLPQVFNLALPVVHPLLDSVNEGASELAVLDVAA